MSGVPGVPQHFDCMSKTSTQNFNQNIVDKRDDECLIPESDTTGMLDPHRISMVQSSRKSKLSMVGDLRESVRKQSMIAVDKMENTIESIRENAHKKKKASTSMICLILLLVGFSVWFYNTHMEAARKSGANHGHMHG